MLKTTKEIKARIREKNLEIDSEIEKWQRSDDYVNGGTPSRTEIIALRQVKIAMLELLLEIE